VGIDFNRKIVVVNQTLHGLGLATMVAGFLTLVVGTVTHFTDELIFPSQAWFALGVPVLVVGLIMFFNSLRSN